MSTYNKVDDDEASLTIDRNPVASPESKRRRKVLMGIAVAILIVGSIVAFIAGLVSVRYDANNTPTESKFWHDTRLPNTTKPLHYYLDIEPDLVNFTYTIREKIEIHIYEPTDTVVMHYDGQQVLDATIRKGYASDTSNQEQRLSVSFNEELNYVYFTLDSLTDWVKEGNQIFTMTVMIKSELLDDMRGFYRSSYIDNGALHWMATTDFEPVSARKAFICFDEPAMKANFTISITIDPKYDALSNMPEEKTTTTDGKKTVQFATSVKMSTYLVCFIVCEFGYVESTDLPNTRVRVWTTHDTVSQANYALQATVNILNYYEQYFAIPFPLPKLDMIAIPDYPAGAMENWGLITFRQTALLYDESQSSESDKQRVATVIAHELGHQWFGNLVTMEWWSDLWLNEGFASFMEYKGTDAIEPDWEMFTQFLYLDKQPAMALDSLVTSHPIAVELNDPSEIAQQFDTITYSKGASVLRMLEAYIDSKGPNVFAEGLKDYLTAHMYGNAQTADLWSSLSQRSGFSIAPMMDTWTRQAGYPIITLDLHPPSTVRISQRQFLLDSDQTTNASWIVPIKIAKENGDPTELLLTEKTMEYQHPLSQGYIVANHGGTGFYRVNYSSNLLQLIVAAIRGNINSITSANRATLINDYFNFLKSGDTTPTQALEIAQLLQDETDYIVWASGLGGLSEFGALIQLEPYYGTFQKFMLSILSNILASLGPNPSDQDSHVDSLLRPLVYRYAASYGNVNATEYAVSLFAQNKDGGEIPIGIRDYVYYTVVQHGGEDEYNWMLQQYKTSNVAADKMRCLSAMTKTTKPYLLQRTLDYSLDKNVVRPQDTARVLALVASNIYGRDLAWSFFRENFDQLVERYGDSYTLGDIIFDVTYSFTSETKLQEVKDFLADNHVDTGSRSIDQAIETIQFNIRWLQKNRQSIASWLENWAETH